MNELIRWPSGHLKCGTCGCSVDVSHVPASPDCLDARTERQISQSD